MWVKFDTGNHIVPLSSDKLCSESHTLLKDISENLPMVYTCHLIWKKSGNLYDSSTDLLHASFMKILVKSVLLHRGINEFISILSTLIAQFGLNSV